MLEMVQWWSMKLDRSLLPVKAAYFCALAAVASLLPYLGVFMKQIGLSPTETAIIYGTMPFVGALVRTIVGAFVDKFNCHKVTLVVCCVLSAVLHGCLSLISRGVIVSDTSVVVNNGYPIQLTCRHLGSYIELCTESLNCSDGMSCRENVLNQSRARDLQSLRASYANSTSHANSSDMQCNWSCNADPTCADDPGCTADLSDSQMCVSNETFGICNTIVDGADSIEFSRPHLGLPVYTYTDNMTCTRYLLTSFAWSTHSFANLTCRNLVKLQCRVDCTAGRSRSRFAAPFWTFALILLPAQIAFAPVFSLLDALTYSMLAEKRYLWGRQRLWGTIGFGTFAVLSGVWMDAVSDADAKDYTPAVILFSAFQLLCAIAATCYSTTASTRDADTDLRVVDKALAVLRVSGVPALLMLVFMFGAYTGLIETFLYWHLQTIGTVPPQLLLGLCMAASCLPEVGMLFAAGWIVSRLGGHARCLCVVCVAYAIRLVAYSLLQNAWLALAFEPLHAITFGLMYVVASAHASQVTPPGLHGTVQGAISALHFGVGKGTGSLVGGQLFEAFGARTTFRAYGVSAICVLFVYVAMELRTGKLRKQTEQPEEAEEGEMQVKIRTPSMEKEDRTEDEAQEHGLLEDSRKDPSAADS